MLKTIVVALDGSELAEQVIQTLQELSLIDQGRIILCHVFQIPDVGGETPADRPHPGSAEISYLQAEKLLQFFQKQLVNTKLELVMGDPSEEIIRLANIHQADLIVIGSRGLTGMKRIIQGSVSSQVVEDAHCSVLVVKPK